MMNFLLEEAGRGGHACIAKHIVRIMDLLINCTSAGNVLHKGPQGNPDYEEGHPELLLARQPPNPANVEPDQELKTYGIDHMHGGAEAVRGIKYSKNAQRDLLRKFPCEAFRLHLAHKISAFEF